MMAVRKEVYALLALGPLPDSDSATEEQLDRFGQAVDKITPPVTCEEAELLLTMFGPDDCYGLAWDILHLIETTPSGIPMQTEPAPDANEWIRRLWARAERGRALKTR